MSIEELTIETIGRMPVEDQAVEIVERKGVGHPDYICDAAMESVSIALSREYLKRFGEVLHHNIDKGLLVAGSVEKRFGGGRVLKPMELIIGDRATFSAGDIKIPVRRITREAVRDWFRRNLANVDPERDLKIRVVLQPGSVELQDIFKRRGRLKGANDTSAAVGYAPFTLTERAVFDCERYINSPEFKRRFPETGEDVKVMGVRRGRALDLTIACPLLAGYIRSEKEYFSRKEKVRASIRRFLSRYPFKEIKVNLNTLDRRGHGVEGVYLSLLGTSAEDADSGQVGRGNRVNGVISLNRPMGTEAAAGKNPVSHVGKIYTILAHRMAEDIYGRVEGLKEVYVWLISRIGEPIDRPRHLSVQIVTGPGFAERTAKRRIASIVKEHLCSLTAFVDDLSMGRYPVC